MPLVAKESLMALKRIVHLLSLAIALRAGVAMADLSTVVDFNIAPQSLSAALLKYAEQSRIQVTSPSDLVDGLSTAGIVGVLSTRDALEAILQNTGLTFQAIDADTVAIRAVRSTAAAPDAPSEPQSTARGSATRLAQAEAHTTADVEEVVVEGILYKERSSLSKMNVPLIEMPQSISVVMRDQMDTQGSANIRDVIRYTAGANVGLGVNHTDDYFYMRGFEISATLGGLYRDGMRQQYNVYDSVAEPYGMERVEVIKGPASVLFGQAEPGGLVNYVSKKPTREPLREVAATFGSYDSKQLAFDFGGSMAAGDVLSYRLTALAREADTQIDYIPDDRIYVAPAVTWCPSEATSLTVIGGYQKNKTMNNAGVPEVGTIFENPNGRISTHRFFGEPGFDSFRTDTYNIGYLFDHRFGDRLQFSQKARYLSSDVDWALLYWAGYQPDMRTLDRGSVGRTDDSTAFTMDNQLLGAYSAGRVRHTYLFGIDYIDMSFDSVRRFGSADPLDAYDPVYGGAVTLPADPDAVVGSKASQLGAYAQDQIKFDERWVLLLGGRYDWAKTTDEDVLGGSQLDQDHNAFTGRAGLLYLSPSGLAPYVSYSESFIPNIGLDVSGNPFKPSTGKQYEAGIKYQPKHAEWFVTLSAFDITKRNIVTYDPVTFDATQTGEIRSKGVELEGVVRLTAGLNVIAGLSHTNAKITESTDIDLGRRPAGQAKKLASVWADYSVLGGSLRGLGFGAGVRYVGSSWNWPTLGNYFEVPSYTVFDAMVRYTTQNWRFSLNASNVTDEVYVSSCIFSCYYGQRFGLTANATYRW